MQSQQTIHYIPPTARIATQIRVAAYCRVSSDSADQLESYAAQVEHYDRLIRQNPQWEMAGLYADEGLTGTRVDTRVDFQRMMRDARRGKIDRILVKSISRLARNTQDCLTAVRELNSLGVSVYFEAERIDTADIGGELALSFYGAKAQEESLSISQNMRWSYQRRMQSGEFITQTAPYGYTLKRRDLEIDEGRAEVVRLVFSMYMLGVGMQAIATKLTALNIPTSTGASTWSKTTVMGILKNEKYIGDALVQKYYTADTFPFVSKLNKGERDMYYIKNTHPAIISREVFEQAQTLMRLRHVGTTRGEYAFSKMIRCGECGATFKRRVVRDKTYWSCRSYDISKHNCPVGRVLESAIEQAFLRLHRKLKLHNRQILAPMLEQLTTLRARAVVRQPRIAEIDLEIANLGRQSMQLHRLFGAKHMDAAHYYAQSQTVNQAVNTLRRERYALTESDKDESVEQTETLLEALAESPDELTTFDADVFKSLVKRIVIPSREVARFELTNGLEVTEWL